MPYHVHALIDPKEPLGRIVQSWKSYTGRWILTHNAELGLGVPGKECWMREYWDRYIRDKNHLRQVIHYIHDNPVKAGLCRTARRLALVKRRQNRLQVRARVHSPGTAEPQLGSGK